MGQVLSKARDLLYDCKEITERLRAMLQSADEQVRSLEGRRRPRRRQSHGGGGWPPSPGGGGCGGPLGGGGGGGERVLAAAVAAGVHPTPPRGNGSEGGSTGRRRRRGSSSGAPVPLSLSPSLSLRLSGGGGCGGPPGGGGGGREEAATAVGRRVRCVCESRKRFEGETACWMLLFTECLDVRHSVNSSTAALVHVYRVPRSTALGKHKHGSPLWQAGGPWLTFTECFRSHSVTVSIISCKTKKKKCQFNPKIHQTFTWTISCHLFTI